MDSYYRRNQRPHLKHHRQHRYWWYLLFWLILAYAGYCLFRPLPALSATENKLVSADKSLSTSADLPWPEGAESAIGTYGAGVLATSSKVQRPMPTASIAKLITALTVLEKFPLGVNQQGPILTLTRADVKIYDDYYRQGGSLVKIAAGEKISEHEALEAMMLPSANNMADSLAIWAFGSLANYRKAAQNKVISLGLTHTNVGTDASGLDPSTTSTPSDLIKLGQAVMAHPLLKQIVSEKSAVIPVAGRIHNINYTLGSNGMIGIKTGNSDQAKGNFLFAANYEISKDQGVLIIGVIMHDKNVIAAMHDSLILLDAAKKRFSVEQVLNLGQSAATVSAPWLNTPISLTPKHSLSVPVWEGYHPEQKITLKTFNPPSLLHPSKAIKAGATLGQVSVGRGFGAQTTELVAAEDIPTPTIGWRLTHPF